MNRPLLFLLGLIGIATFPSPVRAATNQASGLNPADVQNAINASSPGDTVLLPAGTGYWGTGVTVSKAVTILGAGIDQTTLINLQSVDLTTLVGGQLFTVNATSNRLTRISGLTMDGSQTGAGIDCGGQVYAPVRIDHCKIVNSRREAIKINGIVAGLIDHCTFINNLLHIGDYPDPYMNTSWQLPLVLGTTNCVVVEDCVFLLQNTGNWDPWGGKFWSSFENGRGARLVLRNNCWTNFDDSLAISPIIDAHGNQEPVDLGTNTGAHRGTRSLEMYNNIFDNHVSASYSRYCRPTFLRGGTIVIHNNLYVGKQIESTFLCEEEDGPSRFNWLTSYPGYDQHFLWSWNNSVNGVPITQLNFVAPSDAPFLLVGTNVFWQPKPGYTPLPYPHPMIAPPVPHPAPVALVNAAPRSGAAPLDVTFSTAGSVSPAGVTLTYSWAFGDGATSTEPNPSHRYLSNAVYRPRIDISDGFTTTSTNFVIRVGP